MTRDTSIDAHEDIKGSGLKSRLQDEVLKIVTDHGPLSAQEAWHIAKADPKSIIKNRRDGITQRFSELERKGTIVNTGKGICSVSGRTVIKWKATGRPAVKFDKPKRIKCHGCNGKGYLEAEQARLF
jgi:hypothetical protein